MYELLSVEANYMKRQLSLFSFAGFGQESCSSVPPEKRPAVNCESTEAGPTHSGTSLSQTEPAHSPDESTESGESPISTEPVSSPVGSFKDLSPPYDIGEVYRVANNLSDYERYAS